MSHHQYDPLVPVTKLLESVEEVLIHPSGLSYSQEPEFSKKEIIEYEGRWRTFGPEKFNDSCYLSSVSFFQTKKDFDKGHPVGTVIFYVKLEHALELFKILNLVVDDSDDGAEDDLVDCCGEVINIISGKVKSSLVAEGYQDLILSSPITRQNNISEGVLFNTKERNYFELTFFLWGEKSFVFSFCMGPIDKV